MEDERRAYRILVGRPEGRNSLEDQGVDGRVTVKWIVKQWSGETWTRLS
jgi:hypothetical protein